MTVSDKTAEFFNIKKEATVVAKKTEEVMPEASEVMPETTTPQVKTLVFDSPKDLWNLGCIHLTFEALSYDDVPLKINEAVNLWAFLREEYSHELVDKATPAQLTLLRSLFGGKLPDGIETLTKEEASSKIQELQAERANKPSGGSKWGDKSSGSKFGNKSGGSGNYEKRDRGVASPAQINYVKSIAKRRGIDLPDDYTLWSSSEANEFIQENK